MESKAEYRDQLILLPLEERTTQLVTFLRHLIATHLDSDENGIPVDVPFESLNQAWGEFLSLYLFIALPLRDEFGLMMYPLELGENNSIQQLARYLAAEVDWPDLPDRQVVDLQGGREWVWGLPVETPTRKLPPVAFILSPPRSGSTLLRKMMANHPSLFVPPEPNLLIFERMGRRRELIDQFKHPWMRIGLQAIWQQLDTAPPYSIGQLEAQDVSTQDVYEIIQSHCRGKLFVDKSPMNATHVEWLRRAESIFDGALYIHLVRNPYASIESLVRMRFHRLFVDHWLMYDENPWLFAEKCWSLFHQNILSFLKDVDSNRHQTVFYEDLVANPNEVLNGICEFLHLPYDDSMLNPYSGTATKLGGVGDPNWAFRRQVEPRLATAWQQRHPIQQLGPITTELATRFGYTV